MRIMLACGAEGLLEYRDAWRRVPCALRCPTHLALCPGGMLAADDGTKQLWNGRDTFPIDSGLEALALWRGYALTLSGDTDSLTLLSLADGAPQLLAPAGVYPQDLCFAAPDTLAVCGGMDGVVRLFSLPDLRVLSEHAMPGAPQRIARSGPDLCVLCLGGDDTPHTRVCALTLRTGAVRTVCTMAGLPGAVCPDGRGGLWLAVSERLAHFSPRACAPDLLLPGSGLIRHLTRIGRHVLATDPLLGLCSVVSPVGHQRVLYQGDVRQALVTQ